MSNVHGKEFVLTDYAKNLIEFKARQLSRRREFGDADREELQQELWLAVVNQADRFDRTRASLDTFIDRVVKTAVAMILRDRQRQKRANGFHTASLDATQANDSDRQPMSADATEADLRRRTGNEARDGALIREQDQAVTRALANMPDEVRSICREVMGGSISSAARNLKTSRRQIRNALDVARAHLEEAGLDVA